MLIAEASAYLCGTLRMTRYDFMVARRVKGIKLAKHLKSRLGNREEHGTTHTLTECFDCRKKNSNQSLHRKGLAARRGTSLARPEKQGLVSTGTEP